MSSRADSENITTMPVDSTRRRFLSQAAGVATGGAVLALATIPPASAATAPASALASGGPDPIYAAIERHKAACVPLDAAIDVRSNFNDLHMTAEQREQRDELDDAIDDTSDTLEKTGVDLINTTPTTHAGIVTAIEYMRKQMRDDGTYMPYRMEFEYSPGSEGDSKQTMGWIDAFLETIASAAAELGKAVQS